MLQNSKTQQSLTSKQGRFGFDPWLGLLLDDPCIKSIFDTAGVTIDQNYLPKSIFVAQSASKIAKSLVTSRRNVTDEVREQD